MLHFENLNTLDTHLNYLTKKIGNQNIFLVGGCIRDLLLDVEENPTDIDLTMAGKPEEIYKNIDKSDISHFMTEKFWTITLIKKPSDEAKIKSEDLQYSYELTPLRTEWWYDDYRHPWEINRSNDLLLDSNRRDFTFNCMYYFSSNPISEQNNKKLSPLTKGEAEGRGICNEKFLKILEKHGFIFIQNLNLYILQDHNYIAKLFKDGEFQTDFLSYLQNITKDNIIWENLAPLTKGEVKGDLLNTRFIIDPHKWIQDLINKKIKTVGNPDTRFNEDALRIMRGLRLVNILNNKLKKQYNKNKVKWGQFFDYERETRESIKRNSHLVKNVAKERVKDELTKVFKSDNPFWFIGLLDEIKLLEHIFPALHATKNIDQPTRYHPFDVYTHTLLVLFEIQKINTNYLVKFGILYHDVGKVWQFAWYKDNLSKEEIREILSWPLNHRRSWPEIAKKDFSRLWFSKKEIEDIARYVAQHHRPEEFLDAKDENKTKKLRKFLSEAGYEKALDVLDICIADRMGQYNPLQWSSDVTNVYETIGQLNILHESEGQFMLKDLDIKGSDIIKHFKLKPGPEIGQLLKKAFDRVMEDIASRNNKKSIFEFLKEILDE